MFRPCIDVKFNQVVQLEQGEKLALTDERSPVEIAKIYQDDNLQGGHMIDLEGGSNKGVILPALQYGNLQVGGGIRLDNGKDYLNAGATHLIFSSAVFKEDGIHWLMLEKLRDLYGADKIVLAPDVKHDRHIYVNQWKSKTEVKLSRALLEKLSEYCDEFLVHSIEVEGMESGIDTELVDFLATSCDKKITYAGGGTDVQVVRDLHKKGLDITIGKAYFSGKVKHEDLVSVNRELAAVL
ncbi:MAG: hypothetical protein HQL32_13880 [Planctomycetes bacterium]|nr:hypothetical protein [Planctomycetota bacterium]